MVTWAICNTPIGGRRYWPTPFRREDNHPWSLRGKWPSWIVLLTHLHHSLGRCLAVLGAPGPGRDGALALCGWKGASPRFQEWFHDGIPSLARKPTDQWRMQGSAHCGCEYRPIWLSRSRGICSSNPSPLLYTVSWGLSKAPSLKEAEALESKAKPSFQYEMSRTGRLVETA